MVLSRTLEFSKNEVEIHIETALISTYERSSTFVEVIDKLKNLRFK